MKTLLKNQKDIVSIFLTTLLFVGTFSAGYIQAQNVGEPRTVRLFYFLPNDRPYRQEVVDAMKTGILEVQSFFAEQMEVHGHGNKTFKIETDAQEDPIVHRIDADYPDSRYVNRGYTEGEIARAFDNDANITFVVMDISRRSTHGIGTGNKKSGFAILHGEWDWFAAAHELGHAFGLSHDFRENAYIMSYGRYNRSSATISEGAADFLAVHPYFNSSIPLEIESPPTFELLSSTEYPLGAQSVPIRVRVRDDGGLHQLIFLVNTKRLLGNSGREVKSFHKFAGETDTIFEFNYDGLTPSDKEFTATGYAYTSLSDPLKHEISFIVVDAEGNNNGTTGYSPITLEAAKAGGVPVSERTPQVREAILAVVRLNYPSVSSYADITDNYLASITALYLNNRNITSLKSGDFDGLTGLQELLLYGNQLTSLPEDIFSGLSSLRTLRFGLNQITSLPDGLFDGLTALTDLRMIGNRLTSLPDGIFEGLTGLTQLNLGSNAVNPLPLTVSLEKVADGQFKAVAPTGAPFNIVLPLNVPNGTINGGATTITIPAGSVESETLTVTRTPDTVFAVTVKIGDPLPGLPVNHSGYTLIKSDDLSLAFPELGGAVFTPVCDRNPAVIQAIDPRYGWVTNVCSDITEADLAAIESLGIDIAKQPLKVGDFDGLSALTMIYISRSENLTIFEGSISNLPALKHIWIETSDNAIISEGAISNLPALTDIWIEQSEGVTISEGAFSNLPALTTVRLGQNKLTVLPEDIFSGLTSLTTLDLGPNELTSLPDDIFEGLTSLTALNLSHNNLTTLPEHIFSDLTALISLNLRGNQLNALPKGIFNGLSSLTTLEFEYNHNELTTLPDGIFEGLTSITKLWMYGGTNTSLPLNVSLEKVGDNQFKAVAPTGAPFDIVLPLSIANGTTDSGATTITIPTGGLESEPLTVLRTFDRFSTVTVDIGTLPGIPSNHFGYSLVKSADLPLVFTDLKNDGFVLVSDRTPAVRDAIVAAVPGVNSANGITAAHLAAITHLYFQLQNIKHLQAGDCSYPQNLGTSIRCILV